MYIIEDQLCCASDECEPPTRYKVSLMAEKHRVIQVDIDCGDWSDLKMRCLDVSKGSGKQTCQHVVYFNNEIHQFHHSGGFKHILYSLFFLNQQKTCLG